VDRILKTLYTRNDFAENLKTMRSSLKTAFVTLAFLVGGVSAQQSDPPKTNSRPTPTPAAVAAKPEPFDKADVKTMSSQCVSLDTEEGMIELEMYPEHAPESVRNFLNLVATKMLDTTTFSRVVPGFVIQGGNIWSREDAKVTRAMGDRARRTVPDEPNKILHERGVLSMARGEEANTATTHFFILVKDAPTLDNKFAAFGRVIKGMDFVDAINKAPSFDEKPAKPVRIRKATIAACAPR